MMVLTRVGLPALLQHPLLPRKIKQASAPFHLISRHRDAKNSPSNPVQGQAISQKAHLHSFPHSELTFLCLLPDELSKALIPLLHSSSLSLNLLPCFLNPLNLRRLGSTHIRGITQSCRSHPEGKMPVEATDTIIRVPKTCPCLHH